jgi:hypothetical protein
VERMSKRWTLLFVGDMVVAAVRYGHLRVRRWRQSLFSWAGGVTVYLDLERVACPQRFLNS